MRDKEMRDRRNNLQDNFLQASRLFDVIEARLVGDA